MFPLQLYSFWRRVNNYSALHAYDLLMMAWICLTLFIAMSLIGAQYARRRSSRLIHRRQYNVTMPIALWHIDCKILNHIIVCIIMIFRPSNLFASMGRQIASSILGTSDKV